MKNVAQIIKIAYLYIVIAVSIIFIGIGIGVLFNTALQYYVFPKAEKGGFNQCNQEPPMYYFSEKGCLAGATTEEQQATLDTLLRDYDNWKKNNTGDECYSAQRQKNIVDALTQLFVATPILLIHLYLLRREKNNK